MDLKEFTKATLTQIVEAVQETNTTLEASGAYVPSSDLHNIGGTRQYSQKGGYEHHVINVDFDVAISVIESNEHGKSGALKILDFAMVSGANNKSNENSTSSRVKFSIPLALPNETKPVKKSLGINSTMIY